MNKPMSTLTVFCDAEGCTKTWDFQSTAGGWLQDDYAGVYFVNPEGHGVSGSTTLGAVGGVEAFDAHRVKYNLRHCGVDLKVNPETLEPILDRLALGGVSRVSLRCLAGTVSS